MAAKTAAICAALFVRRARSPCSTILASIRVMKVNSVWFGRPVHGCGAASALVSVAQVSVWVGGAAAVAAAGAPIRDTGAGGTAIESGAPTNIRGSSLRHLPGLDLAPSGFIDAVDDFQVTGHNGLPRWHPFEQSASVLDSCGPDFGSTAQRLNVTDSRTAPISI